MVERQKPKKVPIKSDSDSDGEKEDCMQSQFPHPVRREQLSDWSRVLHRSAPINKYFKVKIPWRTILVSFLFLIGGIVFLTWGLIELFEKSLSESYEKLILGLILFIPGSFHTVLAI